MIFPARLAMAAVVAMGAAATAQAAEMAKGTPDIRSAGALAFGPDGVLFIGDVQGGAIFAVDTGDRGPASTGETFKVAGIKEKVAALLGTDPAEVMINDLAVSPASGKAYLSVSRGRGQDAAPAIVRVDRAGKLEAVALQDVPFSKATLAHLPDLAPAAATPPPAPAKKSRPSARSQAITDLAYLDGRVYVAGLSNEQFASRLVSMPFPFNGSEGATSVEIYHGAHGAFETRSPIRTFAAYKIKGEPHLMAAYTCTPLVKVPVNALKPGSHFKGQTIAELGNMNTPLDMIVYQKDGKDYILMANTARGMMKISTEGIDQAASITSRISNTAGQPYEKVESLKGVVQLDGLDKDSALVLIQQPNGSMDLETVTLP